MNPGGVRQMLLGNFSGVRIDGSNATIIGEHIGEFKADRNSIPRMWMDHGMWPYLTTRLYIDQTGDLEILNQQIGYFKDCHVQRCQGQDPLWAEGEYRQKDTKGKEYTGTVLEHLILQHLTAFWEVGEHNHIRLRNADWNDALDMASHRGESVAFSNAYAGNLIGLAELIEEQQHRGYEEFHNRHSGLCRNAAIRCLDGDGDIGGLIEVDDGGHISLVVDIGNTRVAGSKGKLCARRVHRILQLTFFSGIEHQRADTQLDLSGGIGAALLLDGDGAACLQSALGGGGQYCCSCFHTGNNHIGSIVAFLYRDGIAAGVPADFAHIRTAWRDGQADILRLTHRQAHIGLCKDDARCLLRGGKMP